MQVLITGVAGFIGFHLAKRLLTNGYDVFGIDNLNNYYDPDLKEARLHELQKICSQFDSKFNFLKVDIADTLSMMEYFSKKKFSVVIHLAAQAGVRYSITQPHSYINSNLSGFLNILEGCNQNKVEHLILASSSSVYGMNSKIPFSTSDNTDYPISLYAATKKSNELMAHVYSHLYQLPTTCLRFFTVYGPYGRPDMAYYKFTKNIIDGNPIDVFNEGKLLRDFTYVDDIVEGILQLLDRKPIPSSSSISNAVAPFKVYNIGNNDPVKLSRFIHAIESSTGRRAIINKMPMQPGDVPITYADINELFLDVGFQPQTSIEDGINKFVNWYRDYHNV